MHGRRQHEGAKLPESCLSDVRPRVPLAARSRSTTDAKCNFAEKERFQVQPWDRGERWSWGSRASQAREKFMKKFRPFVLLSVGLLSAAGLTPVARAKTPVASDRPVENVTPVASDRPVDRNVGDLQMVAEFEQQVVGVAVSA